MLLLGIDVRTSSIKVTVMDAATGLALHTEQYPEKEVEIISLQPGWAEQSPDKWWDDVKTAIAKANASRKYNPLDIGAIGISYQMHGLVLIDKGGNVLRNSIIWCDSRAVAYGETAFQNIGSSKSLQTLLNSPGNFTAAKLAWVKDKEPHIYEQVHKVLLPGDFIAYQFTGVVTTTPSALSEGVLWNFQTNAISEEVLNEFGFDKDLFPHLQNVFSEHGKLSGDVAASLSLTAGIPVTYKAGDQPNNALSLNVMKPGEVAATAGTSGVIYGVSNGLTYDPQSRINTFAHVNHTAAQRSTGVLLCINGTGILNRWIKNISGNVHSYETMNNLAAAIPAGSEGLYLLPFANGAERILNNKLIGGQLGNIDCNKHSAAHLYRAVQEGIAFAFRYGLDIMRENGMSPTVIRAGRTNMFLSDVFLEAFVNATGVPVELHHADGSSGAAIGAGIGVGYYTGIDEVFKNRQPLATIVPKNIPAYDALYQSWKDLLLASIERSSAPEE
ncbi:MAG TPA: FGGY family carbohydrate kinase [Flavisolibacter sp.]|nr:FGGY family carbohydrate kinase [Flavisolibacter sp.]